MNKTNNCFTTNQTLTLQNFTWGGGVEISKKILLSKRVCKELLYIIDT